MLNILAAYTQLTFPGSTARLSCHMTWLRISIHIYCDLNHFGFEVCILADFKPQEFVNSDVIFQAVSPDFRRPKITAESPWSCVFPDVLRVISCKSKTVVSRVSWAFNVV